MIAETVVFWKIELDEKYVLNSHIGEKIDNLKPRKRGGSASKIGLSSEQICLPTAVQRNGTAVLKATNTVAPASRNLMKLSNSIGENSMAWIDGKVAYKGLLFNKTLRNKSNEGSYNIYIPWSFEQCECISQTHREMV